MEKIGSSRGARAAFAAVVISSLLLTPLVATTGTADGSNCTRSCGDIDIPYPFGVEPRCYHAAGFNLTCNKDQKKLFLGDGTVQVLEILVPDGKIRINSSRVGLHFDFTNTTTNGTWGGGIPQGGPYFLSESAANSLVVVGCGVQVDLRAGGQDFLLSSCTAVCPTVNNMRQHGDGTGTPECRSANSFCRNSSSSPAIELHPQGGYVCSCSQGYQGNPYIVGGCQDIDECKSQIYPCYAECKNTVGSYICTCPSGYTGNASVPNGCKDIDECEHQEAYLCYGICQNFPGSFHCQCPDGTYGNTSIKGGCIPIKNSLTGLSIRLGVGGGTSILFLIIGGPYIMRKVKLQKVKKVKQKNFKQNHGLLLQQLVAHNTGIGERMIITLRDIEKATDNFDRARVIGGGGHGVVFKGILDLHGVAIKKSKIVVQREISEFINEAAVLSRVNHRNVVKLFGCCLETEVPLLVYEFISNGTLCHHLHVEGPISLSWYNRIRIATEVAKALSYLHSFASMPIFHRDIKSSNVLLDDALTAKVSDFGASRYIPIDQTGVITAVQGTMGYLDPMYYYTGRLTDKSDVFSFGVLLVELLTRKKPYVYRSVDDDGLVSHFVSLLSKGRLVDIIDPQVMGEEHGEIQEVATLAAMCTKLKGEDRPTMREVEMALETLLVKKRQLRCNETLMRNGGGETTSHYMSANQDTEQASRQYIMEEEILLSGSYPR
ncbi:unnamed protein product [Urochloa decumbens]|uniref:Protein kinase domain-containing protein n=1 Tax=Urochloa decumbens TaxID=240449 RepID=A0ABC9AK60_9POAL